jgi:hypothetical protein
MDDGGTLPSKKNLGLVMLFQYNHAPAPKENEQDDDDDYDAFQEDFVVCLRRRR